MPIFYRLQIDLSDNKFVSVAHLDVQDRRILELLQENGRTPQQEIARAIGLSQPAVAERIRKLEDRGVILRYVAQVDPEQLGKDITAFVGVGIEHPKFFDGFVKSVLKMPDIQECHRVAGQDSYLLKIRTRNTKTLDKLLVDGVRTIPGVTRTYTTIVLSSAKESSHVHVPPEPEADAAR
jgi:Lrp/AsnC family leucine-responsive transcriptional regulator